MKAKRLFNRWALALVAFALILALCDEMEDAGMLKFMLAKAAELTGLWLVWLKGAELNRRGLL